MLVTVAYAKPDEQSIETLDLPDGSTAEEAVKMSRILEKYPEIDLDQNKLGVFAKLVKPETPLIEGDRVEIYRALPKKVRDPYADEKKAKIREKKLAKDERKTKT
ncbi:MAG: RnfH family protein [Mariprofundaceae bacterium]